MSPTAGDGLAFASLPGAAMNRRGFLSAAVASAVAVAIGRPVLKDPAYLSPEEVMSRQIAADLRTAIDEAAIRSMFSGQIGRYEGVRFYEFHSTEEAINEVHGPAKNYHPRH